MTEPSSPGARIGSSPRSPAGDESGEYAVSYGAPSANPGSSDSIEEMSSSSGSNSNKRPFSKVELSPQPSGDGWRSEVLEASNESLGSLGASQQSLYSQPPSVAASIGDMHSLSDSPSTEESSSYDKISVSEAMEEDTEDDFAVLDALTMAQRKQLVRSEMDRLARSFDDETLYYIAPVAWLDRFFNSDDTDKVGPVNTAGLFDAEGLLSQPHAALTSAAGRAIDRWYGTHPEPIMRRLIVPQPGTSYQVEAYRPEVHLRVLDGVEFGRSPLKVLTLEVSLSDSINSIIEQDIMSFEIKVDVKIWRIKDRKDVNLDDSVELSRGQFFAMEMEELKDYKKKLYELNFGRREYIVVEFKGRRWLSESGSKAVTQRKGITGLSNLGNTCYMNSALQCLTHVEELASYFLSGEYEKHLNPTNPIGCEGKVAKGFASLVNKLIGKPSNLPIAPRDFKMTIGRFNSIFLGYGQQDSQEFLAFLLDGLHEDVNRIVKKPATEKPELPDDKVNDPEAVAQLARDVWALHKLRNDSVVLDLFAGLYRSTLVCPECHKVSITFDPYMDLTLPLPVDNTWMHDIVVVPADGRIQVIEVGIDRHATILHLKDYVADKLGLNADRLVCAEIWSNKFFTVHEDRGIVADKIHENDDVFIYEYDRDVTDKVIEGSPISRVTASDDDPFLVPVYNRKLNPETRAPSSLAGLPFFITLTKNEARDRIVVTEKLNRRLDSFIVPQEQKERPIGYNFLKRAAHEDLVSHTSFNKASIFPLSDRDDGSPHQIPVANPDQGHMQQEFEPGSKVVVSATSNITPMTGQGTPTSNASNGSNMDIEITASRDENQDDVPSVSMDNQPPPLNVVSDDVSGLYSGRESPLVGSRSADGDVEMYTHSNMSTASSFMTTGAVGDFISLAESSKPADFTINMATPKDTGSLYDYETEEKLYVYKGESIVLDWPSTEAYESVRGNYKEQRFHNEELEHEKRKIVERKQEGIKLNDCLDLFAKSEVLGQDDLWYCSKCKELRQATKTIELWTVPDIFTVHLKRFSSFRSFRDKIDDVVDFPIEGLDMSDRVGDRELVESFKVQESGLIYDLFAVDNHFGGLGGGHYTAYAKNFVDGKWYYFDDSSVREADPRDSITGAAYLLFYRRRSSKPLGTPEIQELVVKMRENGYSPIEKEHGAESPAQGSSFSGRGRVLGPAAGAGGNQLPWLSGAANPNFRSTADTVTPADDDDDDDDNDLDSADSTRGDAGDYEDLDDDDDTDSRIDVDGI
ncbi:ubiquitin carboxyl-terminal hydrolase 12 [Trichomonascus vanleenenianus]|uniref:putative ubiquitin-specific protease UBP12 n=1 Tax=Trichomonascus vanleenenianus TaxID=2268995 RepID=UPI003EC9B4E1